MAEQFTFDQIVRQRSTIDRDKRLAVTRAAIVNGLGEHFLPTPLSPLSSKLAAPRAAFRAASTALSSGCCPLILLAVPIDNASGEAAVKPAT
jgi:hypothetical protein